MVGDFSKQDDESLESIDEVLGYMTFSKMRIGLSLINEKNGDKVLYLSSLFHDFGINDPIKYTRDIDNRCIWYEWLLNVGEDDPLNYKDQEIDDYKYVWGLIDGKVQYVKYQGKKVKFMINSFNYLDEDVTLTLWAIQLDKNEKFHYNRLNFN